MTIKGKEHDADNPGLRIEWGACGHGFHQSCIMDWSMTHPTCPKCNAQWEKSRVETVRFDTHCTLTPFSYLFIELCDACDARVTSDISIRDSSAAKSVKGIVVDTLPSYFESLPTIPA